MTSFDPRQVHHGVFMRIAKWGVLLAGPSGIGKSELALQLLDRGQALVCDDGPEFRADAAGRVLGRCDPLLAGLLEVRDIGIIDVRRVFGPGHVLATHLLDVVVELHAPSPTANGACDGMLNEWRPYPVAGQWVPQWRLPTAPGRDLALLVETLVRQQAWRGSGYNGTHELHRRQQQRMNNRLP